MKERIYICHTYYHVYVTFLKELNLPKEQRGQATLVLSSLSIDFEQLKDRASSTGLFEAVVEFDEAGYRFSGTGEIPAGYGEFGKEPDKQGEIYQEVCPCLGSHDPGESERVWGYLCVLRLGSHRLLSECI